MTKQSMGVIMMKTPSERLAGGGRGNTNRGLRSTPRTPVTSDKYRDNFDRIFRKKDKPKEDKKDVE